MILETFRSGPLNTNAYLIACPATHKAALFDAPYECYADVVLCLAEKKLTLEAIYLTHSHIDHIADLSIFKKNFPNIQIWIHSLDQRNLSEPGSDGIGLFSIEPVTATGFLSHDDKKMIGQIPFSVIHTPGHSPGGVCFFFPNEKVLISGDTLFKGTYGSLSLPTAEPSKMMSSLSVLAHLDEKTRVFPGHGRSTTIGDEKWLKRAD